MSYKLMDYLYLDESGDLGFTNKSSKFYSLALYRTRFPKKIGKVVKNIKNNIYKKKKKKMMELKFYGSDERTRKYLFRKISTENIDIYSFTVNKTRVYKRFHEKRDIWNQYITSQLLLRIHVVGSTAKLTIDRFLSQKKIDEYNRYLKKKLSRKIPFLKIKHESSDNNPCLQVADFIVGAFFQKYEHKKDQYCTIIKENTIIDEIYLP
ncbi:MAG: hypothetical protein AYK18_11605 [Theionarchaea archaeon DG-70]|nr:MAG: hypothetical protein AYK18_11605 [Theionarchaea archaeon DG-70]